MIPLRTSLTVAEFAAAEKTHPSTIYRRIEAGEIEVARWGGQMRIPMRVAYDLLGPGRVVVDVLNGSLAVNKTEATVARDVLDHLIDVWDEEVAA